VYLVVDELPHKLEVVIQRVPNRYMSYIWILLNRVVCARESVYCLKLIRIAGYIGRYCSNPACTYKSQQVLHSRLLQ
jgi:hypothetical protein